MNKVNNQVGEEIKLLLDEEAEFYEQTDKDQLKTPPFVMVKRIERPGTVNAIPKQTEAKPKYGMRTSKSPNKRSKSRGTKNALDNFGSSQPTNINIGNVQFNK